MKIFQAFYKEDQRSELDNEFTPFDNTANPVVNFHEYYIYKQIYKEAAKTNEDLWGHFSWQWKKKIPKCTAEMIIETININQGADVYTFHPWPIDTAETWNVWEQGQWCHPNIITLAQQILPLMNLDPKIIQLPMGSREFLCGNYFVGNKQFWDRLLKFLDTFVDACENLNEPYRYILNQSAQYEPNIKLNYKGFLCERMISTFLLLNKDLKVRPFLEIYNQTLIENYRKVVVFKDQAIENGDRASLELYVNDRPKPKGYNWAKDWVKTCEF
jgi:hypothetical protein